jgi:pilus assembly protein CpaB
LLARSYLASQRAQEIARVVPPPPTPQRSILVAKSDVARGQILKPDDLTWQVWPDNAISPAYIVQGAREAPQSFAGWVALDSIAGGAPVTRTTIISPGSGGFLAAVLKPGMRAIQVATPGLLPAGAEPGDRVDMLVYFNYPVEEQNSKDAAVETVLREIRILALGGQMQAGKAAQPQVPGTSPGSATLEVTPKQAEAIALALRMGTITFTLDSLRQANGETAMRRSNIVLAANTVSSDPPGSGAASEGGSPGPSGAEADNAAGTATYLTDGEVNHLLHAPTHEVKVEVTVLRSSEAFPTKTDAVPTPLLCAGGACAVANSMPEKLVSPQDLQ